MATDDFNRANANPIGGNWSTVLGEQNVQLLSNTAHGVSTSWSVAYWNAESFNENHYSQLQWVTSGNYYFGVATRCQSAARTYYKWSQYSATSCRLYKVVAGVSTQLGSSVAYTPVVNDVFKLVSTGTTHVGYINGSQQISQTDSSISNGSPGITIIGAAIACDNWEGGNLVNSLSVSVHDCTDIKTVLL